MADDKKGPVPVPPPAPSAPVQAPKPAMENYRDGILDGVRIEPILRMPVTPPKPPKKG